MTDQTPTRLLLEWAGAELRRELLARRRELVAEVLARAERLGPGLVRSALATGDHHLLLKLAKNGAFVRNHPDEAVALARAGDPLIGSALLLHSDPDVRAAVLAATDPADPGWQAPGGLLYDVAVYGPRLSWQIAALAGITPFWLVDQLLLSFPGLTVERQMAALANLWRLRGREQAAEHLNPADGRRVIDPLVSLALRKALAAEDGPAALDESIRWLATAAASAEVLGAVDRGTAKFDEDREVDWAAVAAAHARQPFRRQAAAAICQRVDCPEELLVSLVEGFGENLRSLPGCPPELAKPEETAATGPTPSIEEVAAIGSAAEALRFGDEAGWWQPDSPLPRICRDLLGDDVNAWLLALELVNDFPGTLPELLTTATAAASTTVGAAGTAPYRGRLAHDNSSDQ